MDNQQTLLYRCFYDHHCQERQNVMNSVLTGEEYFHVRKLSQELLNQSLWSLCSSVEMDNIPLVNLWAIFHKLKCACA